MSEVPAPTQEVPAVDKTYEDKLVIYETAGCLHIEKEPAEGPPPSLSLERWRQELPKLQPHNITFIQFKLVKLLCVEEVFKFISQCSNCTRLLIFGLLDNSENNIELSGHLAKSLESLNKLTELDVCSLQLQERWGVVFKSCNTPKLRSLIIDRDVLYNQGSALQGLLARSAELKFLNLTESCMTGEELLGVLSQLPHSCPALEALNIATNNLLSSGQRLGNAVKHMSKLKMLILSDCNLKSSTLLDVIQHVSRETIEVIDVNYNDLNEKLDSSVVGYIKQCKHLQWLTVSSSQFHPTDLSEIRKLLSKQGGNLVVDLYSTTHPLWDPSKARFDQIHNECLDI